MSKNKMDRLKKLREDRVEKEEALSALLKEAETKALTAEQKKSFNDLEAEIKQIDEDIAFEEKLEARKKEAAKTKLANGRTIPGEPQDGDSEHRELLKLSQKFSVGRAFKNTFQRKNIDGAELEVYQIAKAEAAESGVELAGNIAIPQKFIQLGTRKVLTVGTEGTDVVFTEYGGKVIPYLNPTPVADRLGVTFLQGLNGNVQWPRETGDLSFAFETETSDVDETTPTFDNFSITPKRFGGYVDVTLQMKNQSVFVIDSWLRNKLNLRYALTIDNQIFNGTGSGNQTTGLFNFSGVNTASTGSGSSSNDMTYKLLLSMKRDTKVANARIGRAAWVTNAYGEFALFNTPVQASGVEGNFILKPDYNGRFIGDPFLTSEIIPSNLSEGSQSDLCAIAYSSNWAGLIVGFWGGMDLTYDPYTQKLGGKDRFVVNGFMDLDIEQALEFSICKDWDASDLPALT